MKSIRNLKEKAKKIQRDIPVIFIALKKKETPLIAKILAGVTVAYALSPIDLIPDFIPVIGYLDDVLILPGLIILTIKCIPNKILEECRMEAEMNGKNRNKKKWIYAIPVILIWLLILFFIIKAIVDNLLI